MREKTLSMTKTRKFRAHDLSAPSVRFRGYRRTILRATRAEVVQHGQRVSEKPLWPNFSERRLAELLRACLVSNRVGLAGAESAPFTRRTASRGPSLRGSFFGFRSVSSKESLQRGPPRTSENAKKV